ncbi:MAG: hypothetical protein HKN92_10620 [Chitinophagales bacterium]|nr:hypothetical protein [Chitinophagales bacterium]
MKTFKILIALFVFGLASINIASADVSLRYFSADKRGTDILLSWGSNVEVNNMYYTIERSSNGADFFSIGTVDGSGNSTQRLDYTLLDNSPTNNDNYYRLRMIDNQGVITYSDIVFVEGVTTNPATMIINPPGAVSTYSPFTVKVPRIGNPGIVFQVFSIDGQLVYEESRFVDYPTSVDLDLPELNPGIYILHAFDRQSAISKQFHVRR